MCEYAPRIIQYTFAVPMILLTIINWHFNYSGQNLINLASIFVVIAGLDNLIIFYRCYLNKSSFQIEGTFVIFSLFSMGLLFEKFNKTEIEGRWFNITTRVFLFTVLGINALYFILVILTLLLYAIRQTYRLMTETLLSATDNIQRNQLNLILNTRKQYKQIQQQYPTVSGVCSICLFQFESNSVCVVLPGCQHCYHLDCIERWIATKAICPYCRHDIRLDVV